MVIVESGWGSILPTVIIASMMHAGPAEKSGRLNIGDQIMTINGTSLVGLPLSTCQSIIKVRCCSLFSTFHLFLNPLQAKGFLNVCWICLICLLAVSPGSQVSVQDQDEHCQVPSCHHGAHSQAGSPIPAGLQRPEWHSEYLKLLKLTRSCREQIK